MTDSCNNSINGMSYTKRVPSIVRITSNDLLKPATD